jgi:hypothetical protein
MLGKFIELQQQAAAAAVVVVVVAVQTNTESRTQI